MTACLLGVIAVIAVLAGGGMVYACLVLAKQADDAMEWWEDTAGRAAGSVDDYASIGKRR